jgi:hypothetical protein
MKIMIENLMGDLMILELLVQECGYHQPVEKLRNGDLPSTVSVCTGLQEPHQLVVPTTSH